MFISQLFPFEYVGQESKVIIYGLGEYGKSYIEQILATKWCEIVGVTDTDTSKRVEGYSFLDIGELKRTKADYIIIATASAENTGYIYQRLSESGIPDSKIVSVLDRIGKDYKSYCVKKKKNEILNILIQNFGGLGDGVVNLSVYDKITGMLKAAEIDIQCRQASGEALYAGKRWVRSIIDATDKVDVSEYDLVLRLVHGIEVIWFDEERCRQHAPELCQTVRMLRATADDIKKDIHADQYQTAIQLQRARVKGWDRYRTLGHGDVLGLTADMVKVDMDEKYASDYRDLHLSRYLTIHFGAYWIEKYKKLQVKVWPRRYFEALVSRLQMRYPEYEIVQLGDKNTEQVQGVSRYIKDQNLELVKYILKNSLLHIDSEGGLVHLATALGTKCAVLFGPTPQEYYGYPQNINMNAEGCHNCMGLQEDWYVQCLRDEQEPECMYGITPEMVYEKVSGYLDEISRRGKCAREGDAV